MCFYVGYSRVKRLDGRRGPKHIAHSIEDKNAQFFKILTRWCHV
jgi:hypothetical protein